jgi:hypothetical protein
MFLSRKKGDAERSIANYIHELGQSILRELIPLANTHNLIWHEYPKGRREDREKDEVELDEAIRYCIVITDQKDHPVVQASIAWYLTMRTPDIFVKKGDWASDKPKGDVTKEKFFLYAREAAITAAKNHIIVFSRTNTPFTRSSAAAD